MHNNDMYSRICVFYPVCEFVVVLNHLNTIFGIS
jgi:hypothetical protein